jgi:hypothetical protein|tara:strand:- start:93 stop:398 length:306 start_codon:yes stop_codon:yes gene_type:complete
MSDLNTEKQYKELLSNPKLSGGNKANIEQAWNVAGSDKLKQLKVINRMRDFLKLPIKEEEVKSAFKIDPALAAKIYNILEDKGIKTGMTKVYFFHFLNDKL